MRKTLLLLAALFLISGVAEGQTFDSTGQRAGRQEQFDFTFKHSHLGGTGYRVFDVIEISSSSEIQTEGFDDSTYEIPPLLTLFHYAEVCAKTMGNFAPVRVFSTSKIDTKNRKTGVWKHWGILGIWVPYTPWVYFTTGRSPYDMARTIVHEFVHYLTNLGHPEVNELIAICNTYFANQR